ncbi:MAG: hypothetical protein SFZ03_08870 [Candidatus Melainabacteria bacterium]|nr:hypothetical protein [Candidatus Melainabacteria bacterium]
MIALLDSIQRPGYQPPATAGGTLACLPLQKPGPAAPALAASPRFSKGLAESAIEASSGVVQFLTSDPLIELMSLDFATMVAPRSAIELIQRGPIMFQETLVRELGGTVTNVFICGWFGALAAWAATGMAASVAGLNPQFLNAQAFINQKSLLQYGRMMDEVLKDTDPALKTVGDVRQKLVRNFLDKYLVSTDQSLIHPLPGVFQNEEMARSIVKGIDGATPEDLKAAGAILEKHWHEPNAVGDSRYGTPALQEARERLTQLFHRHPNPALGMHPLDEAVQSQLGLRYAELHALSESEFLSRQHEPTMQGLMQRMKSLGYQQGKASNTFETLKQRVILWERMAQSKNAQRQEQWLGKALEEWALKGNFSSTVDILGPSLGQEDALVVSKRGLKDTLLEFQRFLHHYGDRVLGDADGRIRKVTGYVGELSEASPLTDELRNAFRGVLHGEGAQAAEKAGEQAGGMLRRFIPQMDDSLIRYAFKMKTLTTFIPVIAAAASSVAFTFFNMWLTKLHYHGKNISPVMEGSGIAPEHLHPHAAELPDGKSANTPAPLKQPLTQPLVQSPLGGATEATPTSSKGDDNNPANNNPASAWQAGRPLPRMLLPTGPLPVMLSPTPVSSGFVLPTTWNARLPVSGPSAAVSPAMAPFPTPLLAAPPGNYFSLSSNPVAAGLYNAGGTPWP